MSGTEESIELSKENSTNISNSELENTDIKPSSNKENELKRAVDENEPEKKKKNKRRRRQYDDDLPKEKKSDNENEEEEEDEDENEDDLGNDDFEDDDLAEIDEANIITTGRRTRGKVIDFSKAAEKLKEELGSDDEDDEEGDGDFNEDVK